MCLVSISVVALTFADNASQRYADFGRGNDDVNSGLGHGLHLVGGGSLATADDGSGVAHAAARRRGLSGDEADDRLLHMLL